MPDKFDNIEIVRVLYEISTLIQSDSELEDTFKRALAMVRDAVGCHSASLFIYEEESGKLEDPWFEPKEDTYQMTRSVEKSPGKPCYLKIDFKKGIPTKLNGKSMGPLELIEWVVG